ncbi:MAG TPA: hypothetical protein DCZ97_10030 [Syntrophus sp. (in: bacteria)]|nr:hypothetical protein [Syntrophus sp. (in: bacteria)]
MKGILGKLLDIDLTSGKTSEIGIADETARKYLGGRGLGARLLFDLLPAKTDPLSADIGFAMECFEKGLLTPDSSTGWN